LGCTWVTHIHTGSHTLERERERENLGERERERETHTHTHTQTHTDRLTDRQTDRQTDRLNKRLIYECRCDERLKTKAEGSTRLSYTGLCGGLEHLKIETSLIDERFASVMGECVI
jgi:hypothetical protein